MSPRRVAITGLGLVSTQGQVPEKAFDAWCSGESAIALHAVGDAPHSLSVPYAVCTDFDASAVLGRARLATMDRVSQLSVAAAVSAWERAGLHEMAVPSREHACVLWGTGGGGMQTLDRSYRDLFLKGRSRISPLSVVLGMNNAAASQIALQLGLGGECLTYSVACASSAVAVGEAFRRIRSGDATVALAGGAEAALPFGMLKAWESLQVMAAPGDDVAASCRPFQRARDGLVLGEGAAALVLEEWDHAVARGARIHAEVTGYGGSCDHHHLTAPAVDGQVRALAQALRMARLNPSDVQYVNAHGTATPEGDPTEVQALVRCFGAHASSLQVSATKSMHGHWLGGAGALEILITTLALERKVLPPTAGLTDTDAPCLGVDHIASQARECPSLRAAISSSFAFGGSNAVVVLQAVDG